MLNGNGDEHTVRPAWETRPSSDRTRDRLDRCRVGAAMARERGLPVTIANIFALVEGTFAYPTMFSTFRQIVRSYPTLVEELGIVTQGRGGVLRPLGPMKQYDQVMVRGTEELRQEAERRYRRALRIVVGKGEAATIEAVAQEVRAPAWQVRCFFEMNPHLAKEFKVIM